jgi:hypothetical protein
MYLYATNLGSTVKLSHAAKTHRAGMIFKGVFNPDSEPDETHLKAHKLLAVKKAPVDEKKLRKHKLMSVVRNSPRLEQEPPLPPHRANRSGR